MSSETDITTSIMYFINQKIDYANKQFDQVNKIFNNYVNNISSTSVALNNHITNQNTLIDKQTTYNKSIVNESSKVKWLYQQPVVRSLGSQNIMLYLIFYGLLMLLGTLMYYYSTLNMGVQIVIFHLLLIYPLLIYYFELMLYIVYVYLYSYFYGVPYEKVYIGDS
jgi:hypothetical protein